MAVRALVIALVLAVGGDAGPALRIVGATPKERAVLRQVVAGVQPTAIDSARFRKPPRAWKPIPKHSVLLDLGASERSGLTTWQAWLVVGAYRDRAAKAHLRRVAFYSLARLGGEEGRMGRPPHPPPAAKPGRAAAIASALQDAVVASGATVDRIAVLRPLGLAPEVVMRFSDPAAYLKYRFDTFVARLRALGRLDGVYLEGLDADGQFVFQFGSAERIGSYEVGIRPDLAACNGFFSHSEPGGFEPPPCPA